MDIFFLLSSLNIMAPKKRSKNDAGSSSSRQAFDGNLFANARAFERYRTGMTAKLKKYEDDRYNGLAAVR